MKQNCLQLQKTAIDFWNIRKIHFLRFLFVPHPWNFPRRYNKHPSKYFALYFPFTLDEYDRSCSSIIIPVPGKSRKYVNVPRNSPSTWAGFFLEHPRVPLRFSGETDQFSRWALFCIFLQKATNRFPLGPAQNRLQFVLRRRWPRQSSRPSPCTPGFRSVEQIRGLLPGFERARRTGSPGRRSPRIRRGQGHDLLGRRRPSGGLLRRQSSGVVHRHGGVSGPPSRAVAQTFATSRTLAVRREGQN